MVLLGTSAVTFVNRKHSASGDSPWRIANCRSVDAKV